MSGTVRNIVLAIGLVIIAFFLIILGISWIWALVNYDELVSIGIQFLDQMNLGYLPRLQDINAMGPYILVAVGLIIGVLCLGVFRLQNWARNIIVITCLTLFFLVLLVSPLLILSQPVFSLQFWVTFILSESIFAGTALTMHFLSLPETRMRFLFS